VLPGVGRTRAEAIVVDRIRNGPFHCLAELQRVDGFGPSITHAFRDMVVFGAPGGVPAR
jgi:DNA uptake protein ComE-like DNA-binding protein